MPTPAAEAREDRVVELVVDALMESGRVVRIGDRPDRNRRRTDGLTVDAELVVDKANWALDVITLRWRPGLEAAVERILGRLHREIPEPNPTESLVLCCHASTETKAIDSLIELARAAAESGSDQWRGDEAALVRPRVDGLKAIVVCPWLGSTADITDEVASSMGIATTKKLLGQLGRARQLGFSIALAIDQQGAEDLKFGSNFLPSLATIALVVEELERQSGVALDALLLVDTQDAVQWLRTCGGC